MRANMMDMTRRAMFNPLLFFGGIILSHWNRAKMHHAITKMAYTIPIIDRVLIEASNSSYCFREWILLMSTPIG